MPNEIVLKRPNRRSNTLKGVVRITPEAEEALWKLSEDTNLPLRVIASELIIQGAGFVRVEESN